MTGCRARKADVVAGVKPVQNDARAGHIVPPLAGVAQLRGRVGNNTVPVAKPSACKRATTLANSAYCSSVVAVSAGVLLSAHGKMLNTPQISSPGCVRGFQLVDSFIKPGTQRKANAAHAGVDFQVYLGLYARLDGRSGECLCVLGRKQAVAMSFFANTAA